MHKFSQFDLKLNIRRLPLTYSLGDLTTVREIFTPEGGDIGRTQLPILPPISESIQQNGDEIQGYFVEISPALLVAIREFLKSTLLQLELHQQPGKNHRSDITRKYVEVRRECMNRIGLRLVEVIKQERRLGLYNLFWLVISKHLVTLLDNVIIEKGEKRARLKLKMLPIIAQAFQETIQQVKRYFQKEDTQKRRYSQYIDDTIVSHLGAAFNDEFSKAIITGQIHLVYPNISRTNLWECARVIFFEGNEQYHISYDEFVEIYSGVRTYIEKRLTNRDNVFCEMIANILKIPFQTVTKVPIEAIMFHPTVISLFGEEIKQLPAKSASRKKTFFKNWGPQLGNLFGEDSWEFAINDYLTFAKDLRKSEIIAFLRNRIVLVPKSSHKTPQDALQRPSGKSSERLTDKISYQFDKGRIINDLRQVSLIFLDLRGFTELSAGDISDQKLKEHLYNFFDPVVNILNHFNGVIKTYAGDGILASFGGHKEHALNAVRAAIEIQKFFQMLKHEKKVAFKGMGIGIHTGLVEETYFFPDLEAPSHNTVIGLTANLVGRLSSGKTEKKGKIDMKAISELNEYVKTHIHDTDSTNPTMLSIFEERLFQAVETLQTNKEAQSIKKEQGMESAVSVISGVLNNNGIAISNTTFKHIHALQQLKEHETRGSVRYRLFDHILKENILLAKAGDATFKGIKGKFPVWGVYLYRNSSSS